MPIQPPPKEEQPTLINKSTVYISLTTVLAMCVSVFSAANWIVNRIDEGSKQTTERMEQLVKSLETQVHSLRQDVSTTQTNLSEHRIEYTRLEEKVCMKIPTYERIRLLEHRVDALEGR